MLFVVIPVYNAQAFLEETVMSVMAQPYTNIRLILVNDGSTDASGPLCDRLASQHPQITAIHQENGGASIARNTGLRYIRENCTWDDSSYIAFLDADDLWHEQVITPELMDDICAKQWDIVAFSCHYCNYNVTALAIHNQYDCNELHFSEIGTTDWLLNGTFCANLYRAEMLMNYNLQFPPEIRHNEDVIFMRQTIFCAKSIKYLDAFLHLYRTNPNSITHSKKYTPENAAQISLPWYQVRHWATGIPAPQACIAKWESTCCSIAASRLLEAARLLAQAGYNAKKIQQFISSVPYAELIDRLTLEEMAAWQAPDLILYRENFPKFCQTHKRNNFSSRIARCLAHFKPLRQWHERRKFNIPYQRTRQ